VSDIIDSIKDGANQVLSSFDQQGHIKSALDGLRSQWSEVERRRRVNQLTAQIKSLQDEMKRLTEALGLQVLSLYDAGKVTHVELTRLCERIDELRDELETHKGELAQLKAQAAPSPARCPQCQAPLTPDAEFCPRCGARVGSADRQPSAEAGTGQRTVVRLRCPKCKAIVPEGSGFCPSCGVKLKMPQASSASAVRFCANCGAQMSADARFCPVCGHAASGIG
jgi:RNA polymerase subunit RPABC4/transcription elongation factor Spt4/polyhydroxyalkanoate synthesis regulator phasin